LKTHMEKRATSIAIKGLTGAAALAGANQTYGQVVAANPPVPVTIAASGVSSATYTDAVDFDVDGNGTIDFALQVEALPAAYTGFRKGLAEIHIYGYGGVGSAAVVGYTTAAGYAYGSKLTTGTVVGSSSTFVQDPGYYTNLAIKYGTKSYGKFATTGIGYIGFEFTAADDLLHYGYVEVTTALSGTSATAPTASLTYVGAYYNETAGASITVGQTAVPEPSSLAALAFGAAGLAGAAAYRRKQTGAAKLAA
jgi:hypothetical protein